MHIPLPLCTTNKTLPNTAVLTHRSHSLLVYILFPLLLLLTRCNQDPHKKEDESILTGSTNILVDESLFPIIDDAWIVFSNLYPRAHITPIYKPERTLLSDFLNGNTKTAILARKLRPEEEQYYIQQNIKIRFNRFAYDAIALIVHQNNHDTLMTIQQVKAYLTGTQKSPYHIVFDNANSSVVQYLSNLCHVNTFKKNYIYALKTNSKVIQYVFEHDHALGIIGVNWLKQPTPELEPLVHKIHTIALQSPLNKHFYKPTQTALAEGNYPMMRELYIYNCQGKPGLGLGFAAFLASDRGQRLVLKSGLLPDQIPPREIRVRKY